MAPYIPWRSFLGSMIDKGRAYFLLYDGYADFDVVFTAALVRSKGIVSVGLGDSSYRTASHFHVISDVQIDEVNPSEVDLFVIPGGSPAGTLNDPSRSEMLEVLYSKLREVEARGGVVAAICAGSEFLYRAGMLKDRRFTHGYKEHAMSLMPGFTDEPLTVDGNIITAKGEAFPEFAVEVAMKVGMYHDEDEPREDLLYMRGR